MRIDNISSARFVVGVLAHDYSLAHSRWSLGVLGGRDGSVSANLQDEIRVLPTLISRNGAVPGGAQSAGCRRGCVCFLAWVGTIYGCQYWQKVVMGLVALELGAGREGRYFCTVTCS